MERTDMRKNNTDGDNIKENNAKEDKNAQIRCVEKSSPE